MWFVVGKLWDLKLQIHMIEKECAQLTDVIGHVISLILDLHLEGIITRLSMCECICLRDDARLIATGIIGRYSMQQR